MSEPAPVDLANAWAAEKEWLISQLSELRGENEALRELAHPSRGKSGPIHEVQALQNELKFVLLELTTAREVRRHAPGYAARVPRPPVRRQVGVLHGFFAYGAAPRVRRNWRTPSRPGSQQSRPYRRKWRSPRRKPLPSKCCCQRRKPG